MAPAADAIMDILRESGHLVINPVHSFRHMQFRPDGWHLESSDSNISFAWQTVQHAVKIMEHQQKYTQAIRLSVARTLMIPAAIVEDDDLVDTSPGYVDPDGNEEPQETRQLLSG